MVDEKDYGLFKFWIAFISIFVFVTALFSAVYFLTENNSGFYDPGQGSTLADSLSLVLGIPVAFAGSLVAIVLAQRALMVSRRQSYFENIDKIDQSVDEVYLMYADCYSEMLNFSASIMSAVAYFSRFEPDKLRDDENFYRLSLEVKEARRQVVLSFQRLQRSPVFIDSWTKRMESSDAIFNNMIADAYHEDDSVSPREMPQVKTSIYDYLFALEAMGAAVSLRDVLFEYYYVSADYIHTVEDDNGWPAIPDGGVKLDPSLEPISDLLSPLDVLMLCGLLLGSQNETVLKDSGLMTECKILGNHEVQEEVRIGCYNYGAGFIIDFFKAHPKEDDIFDSLERALSDIISQDKKLKDYLRRKIKMKCFSFLRLGSWEAPVNFLDRNWQQLIDPEHLYFRHRDEQVAQYLVGDEDWS